jgi:hypothetical protein
VIPGRQQGKESAREKLARIDFVGCGSVFVSMGAVLVLLGLKNNDNLPVRFIFLSLLMRRTDFFLS